MTSIFHSLNYSQLIISNACVLSCVQLSATLWTVALQASLYMGFSRQEHWSGFPFPPPVINSGVLYEKEEE